MVGIREMEEVSGGCAELSGSHRVRDKDSPGGGGQADILGFLLRRDRDIPRGDVFFPLLFPKGPECRYCKELRTNKLTRDGLSVSFIVRSSFPFQLRLFPASRGSSGSGGNGGALVFWLREKIIPVPHFFVVWGSGWLGIPGIEGDSGGPAVLRSRRTQTPSERRAVNFANISQPRRDHAEAHGGPDATSCCTPLRPPGKRQGHQYFYDYEMFNISYS